MKLKIYVSHRGELAAVITDFAESVGDAADRAAAGFGLPPAVWHLVSADRTVLHRDKAMRDVSGTSFKLMETAGAV